MTSFSSFMSTFRVKKGEEFTHTSLFDPKGSFYIDSESQEEFFNKYNEAFNHGELLYMTEKHKDIGPILLDFDFRFTVDDTVPLLREYTQDHVRSLISIYMDQLAKYTDVTDAQIFVMEKPHPRVEKTKIKDGFHVVIPNIITKPSVQYMAREDCLKPMGVIFKEIGITNSAGDCFDDKVISDNCWLMYASSKQGQPYYKITNVLKYTVDKSLEDITTTIDPDTDYVRLLSIRNKYDPSPILNPEAVQAWEDARKSRRSTFKNGVMGEGAENERNVSSDYEFAVSIANILSTKRVDSYEDWIRLGFCLRNIDYRLLSVWDDMSKSSPKYTVGECAALWSKMRVNGGLGIGTLKMWAKTDSPDAYKELSQKDVCNLIYSAIKGSHFDVAKVIHAMFNSDYVCASLGSKRWYEFKGHRWVSCEEGYTLSRRVSDEVYSSFMLEVAKFSKLAAESSDEQEQKKNGDIAKKLIRVAENLKNTPYKSCVLRECATLFYITNFESLLDSRQHLVAFKNGIFDLDIMELREGLPEDYISFSTNIDYIPLDTMSDTFADLENFLHKVLIKEPVYNYVLTHLASCLDGRVREERFTILTGSGSNGTYTSVNASHKLRVK